MANFAKYGHTDVAADDDDKSSHLFPSKALVLGLLGMHLPTIRNSREGPSLVIASSVIVCLQCDQQRDQIGRFFKVLGFKLC